MNILQATKMLVDVAHECKALIDGQTGFVFPHEHKQSLLEDLRRIFRTYVMVFGLEAISL